MKSIIVIAVIVVVAAFIGAYNYFSGNCVAPATPVVKVTTPVAPKKVRKSRKAVK